MAEVKLGQLATKRGDNTTVKEFGKQMIQDHSAANDKLKHVAAKDGLSLPF
jgi:putative membrane protein